MPKKNKDITVKEIEDKINELKIAVLKQDAKRRGIRREIARLLTLKNQKTKQKNAVLQAVRFTKNLLSSCSWGRER